MDDNINEIARQIYGADPKRAGLIKLELDDNVPPGSGNAYKNMIVSEILMQLLITGCKVRFNKELRNVTDDEIQVLHLYVQSYGYSLEHDADHIIQPPAVSSHAREALADFKERFYNFDEMIWREFYFSPNGFGFV